MKIKVKILTLLPFLILAFFFGVHAYKAITFKAPNLSLNNYSDQIKGAYHLHTVCSDGIRTAEEIAERASRAGLDFIIITDHGGPNRKSLRHQGWIKGILVIAGAEVSVKEGHFVALGFKLPKKNLAISADYAMFQIKKLGGFSIIAHPYNKRTPWSGWKAKNYSGIELINCDSMWREGFFLSIPYFLVFPLNPNYSLLKILDFPEKNLKKWDELNIRRKVYGFFAVDAHLFYESLFRLLNIHVLLRKPLPKDFRQAKKMVLEAISEGKFYNAIDGAAPAVGFTFWAQRGRKIIHMGELKRIRYPVTLNVYLPFPFKTETVLLRNGKTFLISMKEYIKIFIKKPGVYRVEVYLKEPTPLKERIPWIVSNPIFLKKIKTERSISK